MRLPFDQSLAELFELVADRGIVDVVADLDDKAPDQAGVNLEVNDRCGAEHFRQAVAKRVLLSVVERTGRPDDHRLAVLAFVPERPGSPGDRVDRTEPAVTVEHAEELDDRRLN